MASQAGGDVSSQRDSVRPSVALTASSRPPRRPAKAASCSSAALRMAGSSGAAIDFRSSRMRGAPAMNSVCPQSTIARTRQGTSRFHVYPGHCFGCPDFRLRKWMSWPGGEGVFAGTFFMRKS